MLRVQRVAALFVSLAAAALADPALAGEKASAAQLAWLAGCWAYEDTEPGSGEAWTPPAGGALLSVARRISGGKMVSYEFQRIVEDGAGGLTFIALPSGQPETAFALKSLNASEVVFENLANAFPQRVIYRLAQNGNISARIEGATDDPARAIDFPMRRGNCEVREEPR